MQAPHQQHADAGHGCGDAHDCHNSNTCMCNNKHDALVQLMVTVYKESTRSSALSKDWIGPRSTPQTGAEDVTDFALHTAQTPSGRCLLTQHRGVQEEHNRACHRLLAAVST